MNHSDAQQILGDNLTFEQWEKLRAIGERLSATCGGDAEAVVTAIRRAREPRPLPEIGLVLSQREAHRRHALAYRPHLLRSKKRRQRKKALRDLAKNLGPRECRRAFQLEALRLAAEQHEQHV